jgi:hypothetical protein
MSINAVSGLSGSDFASLRPSPTVPQVGGVTPRAAATTTAQKPTEAAPPPPPKPDQPFILVPTVPLSPTVLAELIGRQFSLTGPSASG